MITQRCVYIDGIGRVHALSSDKTNRLDICPMEVNGSTRAEAEAGGIAWDILAPFIFNGTRDPRILWSVRFAEIVS
jgi:hypothetical protein